MKRWTELCSDVNWEDYHGMWARKARDGSWYVLKWTNMFDAAGENCGLDEFECEVKRLDLSEISAQGLASGLQYCDFHKTPEGLVSGMGDLIDDPKTIELVTLEACISAGLGAPLETFTGSKRPLNIRAQARRYAEQCMRDEDLLCERLCRPVNALGSTAAEYGRGDIDSALHRGPFGPEKQLMRRLGGLPPTEPETAFSRGELVDGKLVVTPVATISQSNMLRCPHAIMLAEHYRPDQSCKCDDPEHRALMIREWGYDEKAFEGIPLRKVCA